MTTEPVTSVESPLLSLSEAAAYCRTTELVVSRAYRTRRLTVFKHGRKPLFRREDLDAWINANVIHAVKL